jgi:DNA-binding transcriptional ArsR family regulator
VRQGILRNVSFTYLPVPRPVAHADPFLAVADPTRRAILDRLRDGEAPVAQLAASFDMTRPAVSRHLRVLRDARLVREHRGGDDGRQRIYQLTPGPLREVAQWAEQYETFWQNGLARLKQHVERDARRGGVERGR